MSTDVIENRQPVLSVVELEDKQDVSPSDILATLWDYADSGAAIRGIAVVNAIERCSPSASADDLKDIQEAAIAGIVEQTRNWTHASPETVRKEQGEYASVVGRVGVMLEELTK